MTDDPPEDGPDAELWDDLLADAKAFATEYREEGWEVLAVRPSDVSLAGDDDRLGLVVFVADDEYDDLEAVVEREAASFEAAEVYRRIVDDTAAVVAIELDERTQTAVVVPMQYSLSRVESPLEADDLLVHVRPSSLENWVTFSHDDPSLFFPD